MKTLVTLMILVGAGLGTFVPEAAADLRDDRPNLVGGEILGRGLFLTFNYERFFTSHLGAGAGLMAIGTDDGNVSVVPVYVQFLSGDRHNLYLGAGLTVFSGGESINDYESETATTLSFGYHFQADSGFYVRPIFTFLNLTDVDSGDSGLLWPGISLGGSF